MKNRIIQYLIRSSDFKFSIFAGLAAFSTYFCMYAFRKPYTAVSFEEEGALFGVDFKIIITIAQLIGYSLSKFIGVKIVSESKYEERGRLILLSVLGAFVSLFFFAISPDIIKPIFMFLNGLLLGMNWGLVCGFIEGRKTSDILGAVVSSSFIISTGYVKQIGHWLVENFEISDIWMPFAVGLIFIPIIYGSVYLLNCIPKPNEEDKKLKQERKPFTKEKRWQFFRSNSLGLLSLLVVYVFLTVFRSIRDDFMAEFWQGAGLSEQSGLFAASETPIAFIVTASLLILYFIKSNKLSYTVLNILMLVGVILMGVSSLAYSEGIISPLTFMILSGTGAYTAYVPFGCILFDNLTSLLGLHYTCGFLIVFADAVGYLGVVVCYIYKNFIAANINWHDFLVHFCLLTSIVSVICFVISYIYFRSKIADN